MASLSFNYAVNGQTAGPIPQEQLAALVQSGALPHDVPIWTAGMPAWAPYHTLFPDSGPGEEAAPGERAAFHCGLWGLVFTVLFFPIGVTLGIIAIVQSTKAKRLAAQSRGRYRKPGEAGLIMGCVALALTPIILTFMGIVSAIAIPALLGQRARARDKGAINNMTGRVGDLVGQYDKLREQGRPEQEITQELNRYQEMTSAAEKNPWNPDQPAYSNAIQVINGGQNQEEVVARGKALAAEKGQVTCFISYPTPGLPGFIGGAVAINGAINGERVVYKVIAVE